jgi:hypothetical protein
MALKEGIVFYAWQSDPQTASNRTLIRHALRAASSAVESEATPGTLKIDPQEAVREESGSPNIPSLILTKIETSDIFICDITTINRNAPDEYRRVPNPNVTFELGYAVAHLGWIALSSRCIRLYGRCANTRGG